MIGAGSIPDGARIVTDPDDLAELYLQDRPCHIYALADLEEPYWSASTWLRRGDAVVGVVSLPDAEGLAVYAVSTADPTGSLALLEEVVPSLPAGQLITAPVGLAELAPTLLPLGPHLRYEYRSTKALPDRDVRVDRVDASDVAELAAFYGSLPGQAFFVPSMIGDGTFVVIRSGGKVVAAAGTHVASRRYGCAAIGSVLTDPAFRGQGLGAAVTAAVVHGLVGRFDTIGLNVHEDNAPARHIYESLGFVAVHRYEEAEVAPNQ